MPIIFENLPAREAEALAYSEGFHGVAKLYARIDDLQRALGQSVAALESIAYDMTDRHRKGAAIEALHQIQDVTRAEGVTKK
jgi:hypothetical protein